MNYQSIIDKIHLEIKPLLSQGKIASYIPALARISPEKFGMAVCTVRGEVFSCGDAEELFSIQSISKVFTLAMVMDRMGDALWEDRKSVV